MSFAIALRWVTVDGHRTSYATALNEAADLRAQLVQLRRQDPTLPPPPDLDTLKGEPALLEWLTWARKHLTQWREQAGQAASGHVLRRLAATTPTTARRGAVNQLRDTHPPRPATGEATSARTPQPSAAVRDTAVEAVELLAYANAADLDPAGTDEVAALLAELRALPENAPPTQVRAARHAAEHAIHTAVRAHRRHTTLEQRRESLRAQARALVIDPQERQAVLAAIDHAEDPTALESRLAEARAGAAAPTSTRGHVARAAAQALADIGCDVDATQLHEQGEVVTTLTQRAGCAVRVRIHHSRDQLSFSLVRSTPGEDDTADQQWFCDSVEPTLTAALTDADTALRWRPKLRVEPGDRPLTVLTHTDVNSIDTETVTPAAPRRRRARHHS